MGSRRSNVNFRKQYLERVRLEEHLLILRRSNKLWYRVRMMVTRIMKQMATELREFVKEESRCLLSLQKIADSMIKMDQPGCLFVEWRSIKVAFDAVQEQRVKFQGRFQRILEPVKKFAKRPAQKEFHFRRMTAVTRRAAAQWIKKTDEDAIGIETQIHKYETVWNELKVQMYDVIKDCLQRTEILVKGNEMMVLIQKA